MPMTAFYARHHDLALRETRSATVSGRGSLPAGEYGFIELYCDEDGCDCRRVLIRVLRRDTGLKVWATLGFGWERRAFYRKWAHGDGGMSRLLVGAGIEPFQEQSEHAAALLALFRIVLKDPEYVDRLKRHYAMHKGLPGFELNGDAPPGKSRK